jgi:hypothetical protein
MYIVCYNKEVSVKRDLVCFRKDVSIHKLWWLVNVTMVHKTDTIIFLALVIPCLTRDVPCISSNSWFTYEIVQ